MDVPTEEEIAKNPYVLSRTVALGNKSFCDSKQPYYKLAPPPKYFSEEYLMSTFGSLPRDKATILQGMEPA